MNRRDPAGRQSARLPELRIMSLLDLAVSTLKELPVSDIVRERLSLAFDHAAVLERQVAELQAKVAELQVRLKDCEANKQRAEDEIRRLNDQLAEEVRIHSGIEFRRGKRTQTAWLPFRPACHLPLDLSTGFVKCPSGRCGWNILLSARQVPQLIAQL